MAHEIWSTLEKFHKGNDHVKTILFETYHREYKNFIQLMTEETTVLVDCQQDVC